MAYRGHIEKGLVVLDDPVLLPEGARVTVDLLADETSERRPDHEGTLYERLEPLIGKAKGLPSDLARNHDRYLHG